MTAHDRSTQALAVALSALAGYVDALGFLKLGGYFVSFMSGNSTQLGVDIITKGPLLPLALIVGFVAGVCLGSVSGYFAARHRRQVVLALVSLLLLVAATLHAVAIDGAAIGFMALAMGAENTILEEKGGVRFGLTYVTGSLVQMGQRIATAFLGGERWGWIPYLLLWAGLVSGAIAGAASYGRWGLGSLWLAAGVAVALTLLTLRTPRGD
jgi:uncharacterized membrane protein YoaK (UPF0700 family)